MSLRDALLAKGLVDAKRARKLDREAKEERRARQGSRGRQHEEEEARRAAEAATEAARVEQARQDREAAAAAREAHELVHRVRRIILDNRLGGRGAVPFFHRVGTTGRIHRRQVSDELARDLRVGRAGIACLLRDDGTWEHHVVGERAARKLAEIAPEALVHWVGDDADLLDPSEVFLPPLGEPSLRPHRVSGPAPAAS